MSHPAPTSRDDSNRLARAVTEIFTPSVLVAVLLFVVGWNAGSQAGVSRWWGLPGAVFAAAIPMVWVLRGVRRGDYTNHHIPERERRRGPLLFGIGSVLAGLTLLLVLHAPRDVLALLVASVAGLVVAVVVNHWWKMSIHAGVAGGTVTVLVVVYGWWALTGVPLVALICWARLRLSAHTLPQVIVGAAVGTLVAGLVFPSLR